MNLKNVDWHELDINVDSLWIIGPRAKGGKRSNDYHGNFAPQIPNQMIQRYTEPGDTVIDLFMGSGTTLFEAETLHRNFIGFDINQDIIDEVKSKMDPSSPIKYEINNCNVTNTVLFNQAMEKSMKMIGNKNKVDLLMVHPPYWDIIKFTDRKEDMSNISELTEFLEKFNDAMANGYKYLKKKGYFVIVCGDLYRDGEVVPLAFDLMSEVKKHLKCQLKGIVVKDMVGNRAKIGIQALWKYRALKNGTYIFKHEYIFVFRKN